MGGEINWSALDALAEMYGVTDIEALILGLDQIRTHQNYLHELASRKG